MQIPIISDYDIRTLINQVDEGFGYSIVVDIEKTIKRGLYSMELMLGMGEDEEADGISFRRDVKNSWVHKMENKYLGSQMSIPEKIILYLLYLFSALMVASAIYLFWFNGIARFNIELHWIELIVVHVLLFVLCPAPVWIYKSIKRKKYIAEISNNLKKAQANLNEDDLIKFAETVYCEIVKHVKNICINAGIDPELAKTNLGKAVGKGSRFYGMGSVGMIGLGLGLSAISSMKASSKNKEVNERIVQIEGYIFYNNVASIFNASS